MNYQINIFDEEDVYSFINITPSKKDKMDNLNSKISNINNILNKLFQK